MYENEVAAEPPEEILLNEEEIIENIREEELLPLRIVRAEAIGQLLRRPIVELLLPYDLYNLFFV